jgi:hypothetical protein
MRAVEKAKSSPVDVVAAARELPDRDSSSIRRI